MKKIFGIVLMSGTLLMACTAERPVERPIEEPTKNIETEDIVTMAYRLVDGIYTLEEEAFGDTGWKESLQITTKNGFITDAAWTSVNEDGLNKIDDDNYHEAILEADGVGPQDFIPALEEALVEVQYAEDIDVDTGATGTAEKFKEYAQLLINAAEKGNTELITVDNTENKVDTDSDEENEEDSGNFGANGN